MSERLASALAAYPQLRLETRPLFEGYPPLKLPQFVRVRACEEFSGEQAGWPHLALRPRYYPNWAWKP